ncbi:DUF4865 family protein [Chimaeribacter arupi]|uniref:DUF4865 family protein n=1 Tax=Chimaeribacter arupi TaxID=2060066 RepID=UPI000C7B2292|nr:DUF4865 family protein [Chimaeribacter arupi]PLR53758.1 DUF4865 domain-containing protein [Chimaeribacter arupi]
MIAMQYRFVLPADYDMGIITRRIRDNGAKLDGFPGLVFKAYLYADRQDALPCTQENSYAPFYLWRESRAMQRFLCSPGFAALSRDFGWPHILCWPVLHAPDVAWLAQCRVACRQLTPIAPFSDLTSVTAATQAPGELLAWDTARWERLQMRFMPEIPAAPEPGAHYFRIGHLSPGR